MSQDREFDREQDKMVALAARIASDRSEHIRREATISALATWLGIEATPCINPQAVIISLDAACRVAKTAKSASIVLNWIEMILRQDRCPMSVPAESVQDLRDALGNIFDTKTRLI